MFGIYERLARTKNLLEEKNTQPRLKFEVRQVGTPVTWQFSSRTIILLAHHRCGFYPEKGEKKIILCRKPYKSWFTVATSLIGENQKSERCSGEMRPKIHSLAKMQTAVFVNKTDNTDHFELPSATHLSLPYYAVGKPFLIGGAFKG